MSQILQHFTGPTATDATPDAESPLSTARIALKILKLFSQAEPVLGVTEIGRRLNIHKSKASRLVLALAAEQFLKRTEKGRYTLASNLYAAGSIALNQRRWLDTTRAELYQIWDATGENVHLAALAGDEMTHLERIYSQHLAKHVLANSINSPMHATSTGKCFLAFAPKEFTARILSRELRRYTNRTVTDPTALQHELALVRSRGFAVNRDEFQPGFSSVAAPIFDRSGQTLGAIAVVAPSNRFSDSRVDVALRTLRQATARITTRVA